VVRRRGRMPRSDLVLGPSPLARRRNHHLRNVSVGDLAGRGGGTTTSSAAFRGISAAPPTRRNCGALVPLPTPLSRRSRRRRRQQRRYQWRCSRSEAATKVS